MRIQHNIMAMNAYRNYSNNTSALSKNLEKLSSGYKINRAGDDAAGLAISEKMRAQITGLKTAQKNAKDGISLIQTAEGALTEVHDMLNRMVELADQSANGTYDDVTDRDNLQKEFDALRSEIDRISKATNFNGINLLDGSQERRAVKALGVQLDELNVDGTFPSGANKAEITMKLDSTPSSNPLTPVKVTDGGKNLPASAGYIEITTGTAAAGTDKILKISLGATDLEITGNTQFASMASMTIGGVKLSDMFTLNTVNKATGSITGTVTWSSTGVFAQDTTYRLTAKTAGKLGITATNGSATGSKASSVSTVSGRDEGTSVSDTPTSYNITFDLKALKGGQSFTIGSQTFYIRTDGTGAKWGTASATNANNKNINVYIGQGSGTAALQKAADAIKDALGKLSGFGTPVSTAIGANGTYSITMSATTATTATDLGAVRWNTENGANFIKSTTYNSAQGAGVTAYGTHSTVEYELDLKSLKAGDTITIGDVTATGVNKGAVLTVVDGSATAGKGQIHVNDLKSASAGKILAQAFETAGYQGGKIEITTGSGSSSVAKLKITANGAAGAVTGSTLAKNMGTVVIQKAPAPVVGGSKGLNIVSGETTYQDIMDTKVGSSGSITIGDMFTIEVKGTDGKWAAAKPGDKIAAGAEIKFTAKESGELSQDVMDMFKVSGGVIVDAANGNDETMGSGNAKTKYDLNFDFSKLAGGQTFRIGDASHGKTFELSLDPTNRADPNATLIDLSGHTTNAEKLQAIRDAINGVMGSTAGTAANKFEVRTNGSKGVSLIARESGTANNLGGVSITEGSTVTGAITGKYTAANDVDAAGQKGTFAQVSWELNLDDLMAGDSLTVGGATVNIVADDTTKLGANDIRLKDAKDATKLTEAINNASHQASRVSIDADKNTITVTGTKAGQTAASLASGFGKVEISSTRDMGKEMGGLTLQIGDTSDDFNQLNVSIKKMNCESLGIDASKINISKQEDASKAVEIIKNAINSVSGTRGDLGALQNRLEHTISNLAVMQENIQDAEATIRDVDVAEEMMAYTKNNILVQSAQAMLAQANQLPQGVLQLLQ